MPSSAATPPARSNCRFGVRPAGREIAARPRGAARKTLNSPSCERKHFGAGRERWAQKDARTAVQRDEFEASRCSSHLTNGRLYTDFTDVEKSIYVKSALNLCGGCPRHRILSSATASRCTRTASKRAPPSGRNSRDDAGLVADDDDRPPQLNVPEPSMWKKCQERARTRPNDGRNRDPS